MDANLLEIIGSCKAPFEAHKYNPPIDVLFHMKGKIPQRNIFKNQAFNEKELEKLRRLKLEITKSKIAIPSD